MKRLGWLPDIPDIRDYTLASDAVQPLVAGIRAEPVGYVSLREWCSPVEDQGNLGSCTAQAGVGLAEYLHRRRYGKHVNLSRLFLYFATRYLLWQDKLCDMGDTGASLRSTTAALVIFGAPPEKYWPYQVSRYNDRPPVEVFQLAQSFQGAHYVRLRNLAEIKAVLRHGFPVLFGFSVYKSIDDVGPDGLVPFPGPNDSLEGGHAVLAIGYDDGKQAVEFRNSWASWGDRGYGWLPYRYFDEGLASDYWTLLSAEFVDIGEFGL